MTAPQRAELAPVVKDFSSFIVARHPITDVLLASARRSVRDHDDWIGWWVTGGAASEVVETKTRAYERVVELAMEMLADEMPKAGDVYRDYKGLGWFIIADGEHLSGVGPRGEQLPFARLEETRGPLERIHRDSAPAAGVPDPHAQVVMP
jgi:hypothetical protein